MSRNHPLRRRPCRICRKWFHPDPRIKERQHVCSALECQRERHRRSCQSWHRRNPDCSGKSDRIRDRIKHKPKTSAAQSLAEFDPLANIDWSVVEAEIGLQAAVVVEETGRIVISSLRDEWAKKALIKTTASTKQYQCGIRDECGKKVPNKSASSTKVLPLSPRDEMEKSGTPP